MQAYKTKQGNWQLNFCEGGRQKTFYLGRGFTAASADRVAKIVTDIVAYRKRGDSLPVDLLCKITVLPERIRKNIERLGLVSDRRFCSLKELFAAQYEMKKYLKETTLMKYQGAYHWLIEFFGADKKLNSITKADCESFRVFWLKHCSACTVSRGIRMCRTIFRYAVDCDWLMKNPFDKISGGVEVNLERQIYVDCPTIYRVMDAAADDQDRLLLALARFGGLRIPSEVRELRFEDFSGGIIRIHKDTKTGAREVPLFEEIREVFERLRVNLDKDAGLIFPKLSDYRSRIVSAVRRAGVEVWEKLFVNLRSSCITDLSERGYSEKTLDAIFGNSALVRSRHYVQFRKERGYLRVLQDDERLLKLFRSGVALEASDDILLQKIRQILALPEMLVSESDIVKKAG